VGELQCITCRHVRDCGPRRAKSYCNARHGRPSITPTMPGNGPCERYQSRTLKPAELAGDKRYN